jgi:chorismate mutase
MNSNQSKLTKDVHMRVSESLQQLIQEIADQNHMKPSSLCRVILARELPNYTRNRFYG